MEGEGGWNLDKVNVTGSRMDKLPENNSRPLLQEGRRRDGLISSRQRRRRLQIKVADFIVSIPLTYYS